MQQKHFSLRLLALLAIFSAFILAGCSSTDRANNSDSPETKKSGIDRTMMDTSIDPREDFYSYAVGNWIKNNPVPDNKSNYNWFVILDDKIKLQLTDLLEQMANGDTNATNSNAGLQQSSSSSELKRKLGDFYASGMDTEAIEQAGLTPLQPTLDSIQNIQDVSEIPHVLGELHLQGIFPYFEFYSQIDNKNSKRVILGVDQGGLGLPSREYYISEDTKYKEILEKYHKHVANMFLLAGDAAATAETEASAVIALETRLAQASMSAAEHSDPSKIYHLMSLAELQLLTPDFDWNDYLSGVELKSVGDINVVAPDFMVAVNDEIAANSSLEENIAYLRWRALANAAPYLSQAFVDEYFSFNSTVLQGITTQDERSITVTNTINNSGIMGFGLGEVYVENYFNSQTKLMVETVVSYLTKVMEQRIPELEWMKTAETQQEALKKLHNITVKVGYPSKNRDYSSLDISRDSYYGNVNRARTFEIKRDLAQAGKPVDPDEWAMTPQTVNAYYSENRNEIVFPAAILQAPFFDPEVDDATNYGAIGMVIAHEMSHGYDNAGCQFDSQGNIRDWWTAEEHVIFDELAQGITDQYSEYTVQGEHLDGELVCGEAIADLNGVSLALQAYELAWNGKDKPDIDGFTAYERFFLSFAQIWANNIRPEEALRRVNVDPHPPYNYRVNGTCSNNYSFFDTFNVPEGYPMRRDEDKITHMW